MNSKIKEYKTGKGKIGYKFSIYTGKDPLTGNSKQERKRFDTYEEAEKAYNKIVQELKDGTYNKEQEKSYKFKDLYEMWLVSYKENVRESTYFNVKKYFKNHILKDLGNIYIKKLTPVYCQKIVNKWYKECGYATFEALYMYSAKVLDYGLKLDLVEKNAMKRAEKPRKRKTHKEHKIYTPSELNTFLETAKSKHFKWFMFFRLLAFSGMRIGEGLALNWSDIDFNENTVTISKTLSSGEKDRPKIDDPKTYNGFRVIALDSLTMKYLSEWRKRQQHDLYLMGLNPMNNKQLLFPNRDNRLLRRNNIYVWNKSIAEKAGIKRINVHGFRHTHASILYENGATAKQIQMKLGHGSIDTTLDIYTHLSDKKSKATADIFANTMKGV
ncbi:tyrosine-type recombinase/integrase [Lactobacillus sp. PSON]|uniref:tyrosine-type recombinase/integrase n=1 Tax=Lactobacillus sp. PSON TaxID=3455454 RepID=UPI00404347CA